MPTTKKKIAEQVQRIYSRYVDRENINPVVYNKEIQLLVEQSINEVLQVQAFQGRKINRVEIPQSSIIKYSVAVSSNEATIPAFPIDLERDMGVWEIKDPNDLTKKFIPLGNQVASVISDTIVESLQTNIGFYRYGNKIYFTSTAPNPVDVYLIVSDFSQISETDPLPLSAAYERQVIMNCLEQLGAGAFAQNELNSVNQREDIIKDADENRRQPS